MTPGTEEAIWALASRYAQQLPPPRVCADCFCVEEFLATRWRDMIISSDRHQRELDALAKKVEVGRRLYAIYDLDIRHATSGEIAERAYVSLLCAVFVSLAEHRRSTRFLNTALKMADGILLEPAFTADAAVNAGIERSLALPLNDAYR